jgi:ADP-glucose pyrophosphorylase
LKNIFSDNTSVVSHQATIQDRTSFRNSVVLGEEVICTGESLENTIRGFGINIKF